MIVKKSHLQLLVAVVMLSAVGVAAAQRNFFVPGSFQTPEPWIATDSDMMTETASGSGVYSLNVTGLVDGNQYEFKILEDLSGDGVDWGLPDDPEITTSNVWFFGDVDGDTIIQLDTNPPADGFLPDMNRVTIADDITNWNAVGDFMDEAGGFADWDNNDPLFAMTDEGNGRFSLTATISTPGTYQYRAVSSGSWLGIGTDQRRDDATNLDFNTFENDQEVKFLVDTSLGGIRFETLSVVPGDTNGNGTVELVDFDPIRDNWQEMTFLRVEGDLTGPTGLADGVVDIFDFREWKTECLNVECATPAQISNAFSSLPEPSGATLLILALGGIASVRPRRQGK